MQAALNRFYNYITNNCQISVPATNQVEGSNMFSLVTILAHEGNAQQLRTFRSSFSPRHPFYGSLTRFEIFPVLPVMKEAINSFIHDDDLLEKARSLYERDSVWSILHISNLVINAQFKISHAQKMAILGQRRQLHFRPV